MRKSPRKGLMRLFDKLKMSQKHVVEDDIAFMITPRINAASRMGLPMDAFNLLSADNDIDADVYADHLNAVNDERKGVVASLVKEVKRRVKERYAESVPSVIVLGNPDWRPSLLGLAANSCAEEFKRPVFLWGRDGMSLIKGSCRSATLSVVDLMRAVPTGVFSQFGGHHFSGGFGVINEQIHYLEERLNEAAKSIYDSRFTIKEESQPVDAELTLDEINNGLFDDVSKLAPFGVGNPKPVFLFKNVIPNSVRKFGKTQEHMALSFKKNDGSRVEAIAFFGVAEDWAKKVQAYKPMDLVASLEKSMYRGKEEKRLRVVDVIVNGA
jgi:single-stranded-DNA-specific exonuclease